MTQRLATAGILGAALIGWAGFLFPAAAQETGASIESADQPIPLEWLQHEVGIPTAVEQTSLEEMISSSVTAVPLQRVTTTDGSVGRELLPPDEYGEYQLQAVREVGLNARTERAIGNEQIIAVSGEAPSGATAIVRLAQGRLSYQVEVDSTGMWALSIPVADLPAGEHLGSVQYISNGIRSGAVPFASFTIQQAQVASAQTWLFLSVSGALLLVVLALVNILLYRDRMQADRSAFAPHPALLEHDSGYQQDRALLQKIVRATHAQDLHILSPPT